MSTTQSTSDILRKLHAAKARIAKMTTDLATEEANYAELVTTLQSALGNEIGQNVLIGSPVKPTAVRKDNTVYERDVVMARINELRSEKRSFAQISTILNEEGFKPRTAATFSTSTVYAMANGK